MSLDETDDSDLTRKIATLPTKQKQSIFRSHILSCHTLNMYVDLVLFPGEMRIRARAGRFRNQEEAKPGELVST